jgi:hypothetical protein
MDNNQTKVNGVQYRLQYRKCGKPGCKCNDGEGHGPYWYSYDGNSAAKYVGINLPEHVVKHIELLKASGPKLKAIKAKIKKRRDDHYEAYRLAERELGAVENLESGEYSASAILTSLGLRQFVVNGSKE